MKVRLRARAVRDLDGIFDWIAADNPNAAANVVRRIRDRIALLATPGLEHMGHPGRDEGTREFLVAPYIVVYEVDEDRDEIVVLAVLHGARRRD
jgi:toxin ParE1/3/4